MIPLKDLCKLLRDMADTLEAIDKCPKQCATAPLFCANCLEAVARAERVISMPLDSKPKPSA